MIDKLTPQLREKLIEILVAEGCCCEEQHDEREDATSLNCLASIALEDLDKAEPIIEEWKELSGKWEKDARGADTAMNSLRMKYAGARKRIAELKDTETCNVCGGEATFAKFLCQECSTK